MTASRRALPVRATQVSGAVRSALRGALLAVVALSSNVATAEKMSPSAGVLLETQLVLPKLSAKISSTLQDSGFEVREASQVRAAAAFFGGTSPIDDAACEKLRGELALDRLVVIASREAEDAIFVSVRMADETGVVAQYGETTAATFDEKVLELVAKLVPPPPKRIEAQGLGTRRENAPEPGSSEPAAVIGTLDPAVIDAKIKESLNPIKRCYDKELARSPRLAGKVVVHFTIQPDGSVSQAKIKSSTLGNENAESCITSRFLEMAFPAPKGGGIVNVNYPLKFSSSDSGPEPMYVERRNEVVLHRVIRNEDGTERLEELHDIVPQAVFQPAPPYPVLARNQNITATVQIQIVVDESGRVKEATIVKGHSMFDEPALQTVKRWSYEPILIDGEPIVWKSKVNLLFQLR